MSRSKDAWCDWPTLPLAMGQPFLPAEGPELLHFLDTETTGLSRTVDRVVEIALCALDARTWTVRWERAQLLDPGCGMPAPATAINGITTAMVRGRPRFAEVWPKVLARVPAGSTVVAHSAPYDRGMLTAECERMGAAAPPWTWVDSRALAKKVLPHRNHKLQDLRDLFRTEGGAAHRALGDVQTLVQVYRALLERQAEQHAVAEREAAPLLAGTARPAA